jgi:hypothetical protein
MRLLYVYTLFVITVPTPQLILSTWLSNDNNVNRVKMKLQLKYQTHNAYTSRFQNGGGR